MIRTSKFTALIALMMILLVAGCSSGGQVSLSESNSTAQQAIIPVHKHESAEKPIYDPNASCSIFIYMCGSNLESKNGLAGKDIDELLEANIPDQVNVVIETGGAAKWHSHGIANNKLQRYIVKDHALTLVEELENESMGNVDAFVDYLDWGRSRYPAERNLLVMWDHGGDATKGVCYDENYGYKGLKQSDFRYLTKHDEAVENYANQKFDMVVFDTCLMGNIETAAWIQNYSHYMIASEVIIPGGGLNYRMIAEEFAGNDDEAFGKLVCDSFMEQCKADKQENEIELSLFDLSKTDDLLNSLEIFYSEIIANFTDESTQNALEKSEYNDASFYHHLAELDTTMKNGTDNNVLDIYNNASTFGVGNEENENDIREAVRNLVIYHVGDVPIQLFPDIDPEDYKNLCYGVSIYYPLKFDKLELQDYIGFCPVEKYAEFLDTLYMHVSEVPMEFENRGSISTDGLFEIQLTDDSTKYLKEVSGKVWKQRDRNNYILIGSQTIDSSYIYDMKFTVPFTGEWYYLGGQRLTAEVIDKRMTKGLLVKALKKNRKDALLEKIAQKHRRKSLTAPIEHNGEEKEFHVSYHYDNDGNPVFEKGSVGLYYDENGLIHRMAGFQPLKKGDVIKVKSEDNYEKTEPFTVESDDMTVDIQMLEPGIYRVQIIAADINNNYISSDYAFYKVSEDSVKALGVQKSE